jgi:hypothetical protein
MNVDEPAVTLPLSKFKEILIHSWNLLPKEKQLELVGMGIYPKLRLAGDGYR